MAGAGGAASGGTANVGFAVFLAAVTAVSLSALVNARYVLEDPFVAGPLDTLRVAREFALVKENLAAMAEASCNAAAEQQQRGEGSDEDSRDARQRQPAEEQGAALLRVRVDE